MYFFAHSRLSTVVTTITVGILLVGFQNCGQMNAISPQATQEKSSSTNIVRISKATSAQRGDTVNLEVTGGDLASNGIINQSGMSVRWFYQPTLDDERTALSNASMTHTIQFMEATDAGLYSAVVEANEGTVEVAFQVAFLEPVEPPVETPLGTYNGYFLDLSGAESRFIQTQNISRPAALENCQQNSDLNPTKGIYCTWNQEEIFRRAAPQPALGTYEGFMGNSLATVSRFIRTENISQADALANCELNANNNPSRAVRCNWNGDLLWEREGPNPAATYEGFMGDSLATVSRFIRTENITQADALANCELNAGNNPTKAVRCMWNNDQIFEREAPGPLAAYEGFMGNSMNSLSRFIRTASITRADALANCQLNARNNPTKAIRCNWNEDLLWERDNAQSSNADGTYRGFMGDTVEESSRFILTRNISRADALANCKRNGENNPARAIRCTFNGVEIYKREALGTYRGYMGNKIQNVRRFILTRKITRRAALQNCRLNARNNPNKAVRCTWNGSQIFRRP